MARCTRALAASAALALAVSATVRADGEDPVVRLDEIVVRLPRVPAPADSTAAVTIVDAERFAGEAKDVAALVSTAPGVAVQEYGGLGQLSTVSIRGSPASGVKVRIDGIELETAAGVGVDLSTIPRSWISAVEIVRGAEGARYGAGALGGVVNVVTRSPAAGMWSARLAGGSFLTGSLSGDLALGGERWGVLLGLSFDGSRGRFSYAFDTTPSAGGGIVERLRERNGFVSGGLLAKAWSRAGEGRIEVVAQISGGSRQIPGDPYSDVSGPALEQRDGRLLASVRYARLLGEGLGLSLGLEGRGEGVDLATAGGSTSGRDAAGRLRAELSFGAGPSLLLAGVQAGLERLAADGLGAPRARADLAAWVSEDLALAGGALRIAPALRAERLGAFSGLSGKLGTTIALWGPLSLRASAGRTFRAPSFAELFLEQAHVRPNPDLRSEVGVSADAAAVAQGRLGIASLGVFTSLYEDLVVYVPASFQDWTPRNLGRASMRGLEAELATSPVGSVGASAQLAYTLLASETLRGSPAEVGREVPHRPRHRLFARLGIAPPGCRLHAEMHLVGRQLRDALGLSPVPSALTFHAGGAVRLWRRPEVWLQLDVKNLLDDRTLQDGFGNPLPGRLAMVTLRAGSEENPLPGDGR